MTKEVQIGGQSIKLRATGNLPLAYRLMFNRDLLQDVDKWREQLRLKLEEAAAVEAAEAVETLSDSANDNANDNSSDNVKDNSGDNAKAILYTMDIALIARLAYCMAKCVCQVQSGSFQN
ncbi:MAG: hypothetical protein IJR72_03760 [Oscillospiraceae bacterium]|nr:hypothetical protein [Oscillospiraceae bacterium]